MPRTAAKKRTTRSAALARGHDDDSEDVKSDVHRLSTKPLESLSRTHRAELNGVLGQSSLRPTTSFCTNWASTRNVDPALVDDWLQRRTGGRRKKGDARRGTTSRNDACSDAGPPRESPIVDIHVKRERAESPSLAPPRRKKAKTRGTTQGQNTNAKDISQQSAARVRHTRAHDTDPHPACSTCAARVSDAPSTLVQGSDVLWPAVSVGSTNAYEICSGHQERSGYAVSHALKSALRLSSQRRPVPRRPRQVHFSEEISEHYYAAYTYSDSQDDVGSDAYTRSGLSVPEEDPAPSLPPRLKRKRFVYYDATAVTGAPSRVSGPANNVARSDPWPEIPTSAIRSNARSDDPENPADAHVFSRSTPADELAVVDPFRALGRVALQDETDLAAAESSTQSQPKRLKTHRHLEPALQLSRPLMLMPTPQIIPNPPRMPSPQVKVEDSFFSPSFFASPLSSPRSLSPFSLHLSDDDRRHPSSSPPTSPFVCSSPALVSSVPKQFPAHSRVLALRDSSSVEQQPEAATTATDLQPSLHLVPRPGSLPPPEDISPRPRTSDGPSPSSGSRPGTPEPSRLGSSTSDAGPATCVSQHPSLSFPPSPSHFPPPEDVPPRPRTPNGPSPSSGSRPGTPQPHRPGRPGADGSKNHAPNSAPLHSNTAHLSVRISSPGVYPAPADIPPRPRSPDGPSPSSGSRPGTPQPYRPGRPGSGANDVRGHATLLVRHSTSIGSPKYAPRPSAIPVRPGAYARYVGGRRVMKTKAKIEPRVGAATATTVQADSANAAPASIVESQSVGDPIALDTSVYPTVDAQSTQPAARNEAGAVPVKRELQDAVPRPPRPLNAFVLDDDEDDEPLCIVLARRRQNPASPTEAKEKAPKQNKNKQTKGQEQEQKQEQKHASAGEQLNKARGKRKVKVEDASQAQQLHVADVRVKTENANDGSAPSTTVPQKRGRKKNTQPVLSVDPHAQLGTAVDGEASAAGVVSVKIEPATVRSTKKRAPAQRKPRGKKAPTTEVKAEATASVLVPVRNWDAAANATTITSAAPVPAETKGKGKGKKQACTPKGKGRAHRQRKDVTHAAPVPQGPSSQWTPADQHADDADVAALPDVRPYHGPKHPPRTCTHPAQHVLTVEHGLGYDEAGFECMELSALPWLAAVGYKAVEVRFGAREVLFGECSSLAARTRAYVRSETAVEPAVPHRSAVDEGQL
ncbi:hypothetical protein C8Q80DRAFT_1214568 [Daedaleopsis nitida]|nr:hypothetical protein C8Q80DRAFT_1214568 [Daedaleopsis nitida]